MEFKIGDSVVIDRGWRNIYEGKKGKIIDISLFGNIAFYKIKFEDNSMPGGVFSGENLKIVEHKPKFKLGDKVKILDKNSIYIDKIGKVRVIIENSGSTTVDVSFPSGQSRYLSSQLELVELATQLENLEVDNMKELKNKYKEAYKQYEETKEIEKEIREKNKQNLIRQSDLMDKLAELERNILEEAKK